MLVKLTPGVSSTNPMVQSENEMTRGIWFKRCHLVSPIRVTRYDQLLRSTLCSRKIYLRKWCHKMISKLIFVYLIVNPENVRDVDPDLNDVDGVGVRQFKLWIGERQAQVLVGRVVARAVVALQSAQVLQFRIVAVVVLVVDILGRRKWEKLDLLFHHWEGNNPAWGKYLKNMENIVKEKLGRLQGCTTQVLCGPKSVLVILPIERVFLT